MRKVIMFIMAVALFALPTMAQQQEWKSTSTMQGTGSYVAPVTSVGAAGVASMGTTTESYSPTKAPTGPRRDKEGNTGFGEWEEGSPIGDAVLPLLLMALAFAGVVYYRRRAKA